MSKHDCTVATAAPNFALVKYWGKADDEAMMPAVPSLAITLDGPEIGVRVSVVDGDRDTVTLDGEAVDERWRDRTQSFLDMVRSGTGSSGALSVESTGGVVPAAGLASSAAYFAALSLAVTDLWGLDGDEEAVSDRARRGSVSAARSVPGGYVALDPQEAVDGRLPARTVYPADHWDLAVVVAVVQMGPKDVKSSDGMKRSRETSPYYPEWVRASRDHMTEALEAMKTRDLERLARVAESSCIMMHACAMASDPPVIYMRDGTRELMELVRWMRQQGVGCFYTVDAGPQVKVVCQQEDVERVKEGLDAVSGVRRILVHRPGPGARLVPSHGDS